jgi:hypothetical protein
MAAHRASSNPMGTVALVLLSVAVAGGGFEVALRLLAIDVASYHSIAGFAVYDADLGWKLAPARETLFKGTHFSVRVAHNSEGLRDRHYAYDREPGRRRILVLGDSVVWCWGVEQTDCFTERLERALGDTDVINAGVPGYSTAQELLFYEREGRRYQSDLVVLVMSPNDPDDNIDRRGPRFQLDGGQLRHTKVSLPRRKSFLHEWLQGHSRLFASASYLAAVAAQSLRSADRSPAALAHVGDGRAAMVAAPTPTATPSTWALTEALLDRLDAAVQMDGARLVVVLEEMSVSMGSWQRGFWAARGVPCLELEPALAAAEKRGEHVRLQGDPHLSALGQAVAAAELGLFLERQGVLGPPGSTP